MDTLEKKCCKTNIENERGLLFQILKMKAAYSFPMSIAMCEAVFLALRWRACLADRPIIYNIVGKKKGIAPCTLF